MKAKINGIEFEGTPEEFAKFIVLKVPKAEHQPKQDEARPRTVVRCKSCTIVSVLYRGEPVGTMNLVELSLLLGISKSSVKNKFQYADRIEYNGYSATVIKRGVPNHNTRVKAIDTKGNNRVFNSLSAFCLKTSTPYDRFKRLRSAQPEGPWKINGYIVERIN